MPDGMHSGTDTSGTAAINARLGSRHPLPVTTPVFMSQKAARLNSVESRRHFSPKHRRARIIPVLADYQLAGVAELMPHELRECHGHKSSKRIGN
jgi:hypothetical protein